MSSTASFTAGPALDVCIRGGGAVGTSLALALSRQGLQVGLVAPPAPRTGTGDLRAYALNAGSVALLQSLRVWDALPDTARTPVDEMRVHGDERGQLGFSAWQQQVDHLAWIVDAAALDRVLGEALRYAPHVQRLDEAAPAALLAVCEGRASATREALGAGYEARPYGHTAIAARLVCDLPHRATAWQWFRSPDILALLPFDQPEPGRSFGLVWSLPQAQAEALLADDDRSFEACLNLAVQEGLAHQGLDAAETVGTLQLASARAGWPLMIANAQRWSGDGWVLVGDAAHAVHPLSGQGLNLGLGDVSCLVRVIAQARRSTPWRSPGDARVLRRYARERRLPTLAMGGLTDGLLNLFATPAGPLKELRNHGMDLIHRLGPLKRWLGHQALDSSPPR